jgi:uncharacterized membrane-anchored protein YhcB (DUF1043 family)
MTMQMRRRPTTAPMLIMTSLLAIGVAPGAAADRLNDKDVKELMVQVDENRDRFEDQLDGKLKRSILRGPRGEVNVGEYLDDLQANVDKMKDRFTPQYAASAEVTAVLRQGTDIQRYMSTLPPDFDGVSEWNRLSASLGQLASVYGAPWPLSEGHAVRRMNDGELKKTADELSKSADVFKKELDSSLKKDKTINSATREAAVQEADGLKKDAKKLGSLVGDGRPASGEAQALLQRAAAVQGAISGRTLSPAAQSAWGAFESGLGKVAQAFNMPTRVP